MMRDYFARLAQRSDVSAVVSAARPAADTMRSNGSDFEQHAEVIVSPADVTTAAPAIAVESAPRIESPSAPASSAPLNTGDSALHSGRTLSVALPDADLARDNSFGSPDPDASATIPTATATSAPPVTTTVASAPQQRSASASTPTGGGRDRRPARASTGGPSTAISRACAAPVPHTALTGEPLAQPSAQPAPTVATPARYGAAHAAPRTPRDTTQPGNLPASAAAATAPCARPVPQDTCAAARATTPHVQTIAQVHIGHIELDVRQAAPTSATLPAPAPLPPAPRGAAFNPHRHYLRGL